MSKSRCPAGKQGVYNDYKTYILMLLSVWKRKNRRSRLRWWDFVCCSWSAYMLLDSSTICARPGDSTDMPVGRGAALGKQRCHFCLVFAEALTRCAAIPLPHHPVYEVGIFTVHCDKLHIGLHGSLWVVQHICCVQEVRKVCL